MLKTVTWNLVPSYLVFRSSVWTFAGNRRGVLVEIDGEYRHGSAGKDDAKVMFLRLSEACELTHASALVVDLRRLDYQWGDDIEIQPRDRAIPVLAVIDETQRKALAPMIGDRYLRTDLAAALDEVEGLAVPKRSPKTYVWSELWRADDLVLQLRGATDGSVDRFSTPTAAIPVGTYASEEEARADLQNVGYQRVEGRS